MRLECRYDRLTRLSDIINAAGEHYRLTYDKAGQLICETDFTGRTLQYEYDAAGRRICTRYLDNHFIRWYYDDGDRVIQRQAWQTADGHDTLLATTDYRYDAEHRLISARNPDTQVEFEYDADGNITAETLNGRRTEQTYHPLNGHALSWQLDNVSMQFARGPMGRVTQWQVNDHAPLNISHDALGRETQRCSEAGFRLSQRYSPTGNITGQWAGTQDGSALPQGVSRSQEYDRAYNLTRIRDQRWGNTDYRYDNNDQVTFAEGGVRQLPKLEVFAYDRNLNILHQGMTRNLPDELMQFTEQVQQTGRVTTRGDTRYRYDACGRLVEKLGIRDGYRPQQWRYRWDSSNQLSELITPEGQRWQYRYDAFGRRISKRKLHATKGIAGYDFHWSGNQLVAETPVYADGTAAHSESIYWLYEPGALTPGARYQHGELHYIVRDHMGTPRELLTESGKVVRAQKLSVWGKTECYRFNGWHAANDDTAPECPWRFAGQYADPESGLHYNRFRYYDDDSGQYLSPDPIGLAGGINPYGYVANPLRWVDPLGLCKDVPDFYVGPNGPSSTMPSTAYRYMNSTDSYAAKTMTSKSAPLSYFGYTKYNSGGEARNAYQIFFENGNPKSWSDARLLGEFDTLQLYKNGVSQVKIPLANGGKGPELEIFTSSYPQYGDGGAIQLLPSERGTVINFNNLTILPE
ncbi:MAG TPA: RHS repeat-associated core domain-containing protein [Scandinavium sp.]|jgi:RHS repeat-associated protein|uniref:RHS repeat-associated core domain-containing protein n=1 Tax=Scandinavium sp. TaxID=2830653 RepID=UPI002E3354C9|nr:RHS repeat-associated core domain-containing protein [Scandinavium sp.]HEX4504041.1 RHS repeat-associated core domain-containing protein [Scandinavium sp.]